MDESSPIAPEGLKPYVRRDPATGRRRVYWRRRHDVTRSPTLRAFHACIAARLRGRQHRTGDPRRDSLMVRQALTEASQACSLEIRRKERSRLLNGQVRICH